MMEDDEEKESKERFLQKHFLKEWELVKSLLDDILRNGGVSDLSSVQQIRLIVEKYQEQGHLLEPYLESMVSPLMALISSRASELNSNADNALEVIKPLCIIVYSLVTVCHYKAVIKFFPHHVSNFEPAVTLLETFHDATPTTFLRDESTGETESKCVILLWLSILILIPFDISSVDTDIVHKDSGSNTDSVLDLPPLVMRILRSCKDFLSSAGPMRTMASLVLSRLLTRPDMHTAFMSFMDWIHGLLSSVVDDTTIFRLLGSLETLAAIFKIGDRNLLVDVIPLVSHDISSLIMSKAAASSPLLRKYLMKLVGRMALVCLPSCVPAWNYTGSRTSFKHDSVIATEHNHRALYAIADTPNAEEGSCCFIDENMHVPDTVEESIGLLLSGLKDTDTVVRWSSAKGIGRTSSHLPSTLVDEVLSSVVEMFSPGEGDSSWHGACLTIAELARRGLLLPAQLPKVVPFVIKALHYDVRRGQYSIGSHVRDAAAYICWAFGRAYRNSDMRVAFEHLSPHIMTIACYDREVNCRRAAAAAFQENVGRQGNYPHGIDIVNSADYFTLSSRVNSYLHVAIIVAQYQGYLHPFVDELLHSKICHWDRDLRELAVKGLATLVPCDPEYFMNSVLEELISSTLSLDLCIRHGSTLACGEVVFALHACGHTLPSGKQEQISGIVCAIEKARLYRGKGGEIMRQAVSQFIESISKASLKIAPRFRQRILDALIENLRHPNSAIQRAASEAIKHFVREYAPSINGKKSTLVSKFLEQLCDQNVAVRRGASLALSVLPLGVLSNAWHDVILKLCAACLIEENPEDRDAEARVNAVRGLTSVCATLSQSTEGPKFHEHVESLGYLIKNEVFSSLFASMEDYSVDNRGDVGSWIREAALEGLQTCTLILCSMDMIRCGTVMNKNNCLFFDESLALNVVKEVIKQAAGKMDKIREAAAKVLQALLYNSVVVPYIPHREKLQEIIPSDADVKWSVPASAYPCLVQLLQFSCYSRELVSGLVTSIGGLQESLSKASFTALLDYLQVKSTNSSQCSREAAFCSDMLWVLNHYKKCDRIIVPAFKTIDMLLSKKIFLGPEVCSTFCAGVLDSVDAEFKGSRNFTKLSVGVSILGYIGSLSELFFARAVKHLLTLLTHRFAKIRKSSAEQMYLVLLQNERILPTDKVERAIEIISQTAWDGDLGELDCRRKDLYDVFVFDIDLLPASDLSYQSGKKAAVVEDENASYSSLVESAGF